MSKKIIGLLLLLVVVFPLSACFFGFKETPQQRIERIYKIDLPEEMTVEYNYYSKDPHGDFRQYTIFKLEEEPTAFLEKYQFSTSIPGMKSSLYVPGAIPQEYRPNWDDDFLFWFYNPKPMFSTPPYAIYYPDTMKLIVVLKTG